MRSGTIFTVGSVFTCCVLVAVVATYVEEKRSSDGNALAASNVLEFVTTAPGDAPAGYTVITSTDFGKAFSAQKDDVTSVRAALESTFPELAKYFAAKLVIGSAYQAANDSTSGGATFSSRLNDQPVKGFVSCKLKDKGAVIAVVYARAGTSKADWDKLMSPAPTVPPQQQQKGGNAAAADDNIPPLREYDFPDGTGSVQLAAGWTTQSPGLVQAVILKGPDEKEIEYNISIGIRTPESVQRQQSAFGYQPPAPQGLVAPLSGPVEALKNLLPQISRSSVSHGGPSLDLDQIISTQDEPSNGPNIKTAFIVYDVTKTQNGQSIQMRVAAHMSTGPSPFAGSGIWIWNSNSVAARRSAFDREEPLMSTMLHSIKYNMDRARQAATAQNNQISQQSKAELDEINRVGEANLQAQRQEMQNYHDTETANHNAAMKASQDRFAQEKQQWASDETQKQRANADFIEQIQGTRTIYDTRTGASGQASLSDVNGVVDALDQAALDPNRFVQIPLRDQLYAPTVAPGQ